MEVGKILNIGLRRKPAGGDIGPGILLVQARIPPKIAKPHRKRQE
jgi:hypothetical protein